MGKDIKKTIIRNWITKAENDLEIAKIGLSASTNATDVICFHCQQAVEKYLKMFLMAHDIDFPKTHNIGILLEMCTKINQDFILLAHIAFLTEYAVELRYPDDFYIPDMEETKKAYEIALQVKEFVMKKLNLLK